MENNKKLLGYFKTNQFLFDSIGKDYLLILERKGEKEVIKMAYERINAANKVIAMNQSECPHPLGFAEYGEYYCPFCGAALSKDSDKIIVPIQNAKKSEIAHTKLMEALTLSDSLKPSEIVSYIEQGLEEEIKR
ncbi:MAG: hypothetical protein HFI36_01590 [Bacilli bacterium]|jgi:hypothetical protein|nr:hypothetical protein [Bacilli bacterium]MCX4254063.1 hypothetical protein [Bacilli bacterium]